MNRKMRRDAEKYRRKHGAKAVLDKMGLTPFLKRQEANREYAIAETLRAHGLLATLEVYPAGLVHKVINQRPHLANQLRQEMKDYIAKQKGGSDAVL